MKKYLSVLLISLVGMLALNNCASSGNAAQSSTNENEVSQEAAKVDATSTAEPTAIPQPTPTPELVHSVLFFEEDFSQSSLDWEARKGVTAISSEGIELAMPKDENMGPYMGLLAYPWQTLQVKGDCTFEIKMNGGYSFSGPTFNVNDNYYAFILSPTTVGLLRPSLGDKAFDALGEYKNQASDNAVIIKMIFIGDEVQVFINDQFLASRTDEVFSSPKTFDGFYVVNGDSFNVTGINIWGDSLDDLEIGSKIDN